MRRFSQRTALVTLNEINVTPLLDLAFVLLIIFVITTPVLEQGMDLRLPPGGKADGPIEKDDIQTVEISPQGQYMFRGRLNSLDQIEQQLVAARRANPNLVVYVRADEQSVMKYFAGLVDRLNKQGITRYSLRTVPPNR